MPVLCTGVTAMSGLHSGGSRKTSIKQMRTIHGSGKEELKLSLLANDSMLYVENPKEATKKLEYTSSARLQDVRST